MSYSPNPIIGLWWCVAKQVMGLGFIYWQIGLEGGQSIYGERHSCVFWVDCFCGIDKSQRLYLGYEYKTAVQFY